MSPDLLLDHADDGNGKKTPKLVDFGLHKVIHLHSDESIRGGVYNYATDSRSGSVSHRGRAGSYRGGGSVKGPSFDPQSAAAGATLPLCSLNDDSHQHILGRNGSVHAKNNFAGIQGQTYQMTGGCGSLM